MSIWDIRVKALVDGAWCDAEHLANRTTDGLQVTAPSTVTDLRVTWMSDDHEADR